MVDYCHVQSCSPVTVCLIAVEGNWIAEGYLLWTIQNQLTYMVNDILVGLFSS